MKILVSSGGTGGHIYPAISLIKYLENNGEEVMLVGVKGKLEEEIAKKEDIKFIGLELGNRNGLINKIKLIFKIIKEIFHCLKLIKNFKPQIVIGFGNYISVPLLLASRIKKVPIFLHEQNSMMGKANIMLGYFASKIGYSIPLTKTYHKHKLISVGNPRSSECLKPHHSNTKIDITKNNILIFMGSLGSSSINNILKEYLMKTNDNNVYHIITGKNHYEEFIKNTNFNEFINVYPYVDDMIPLMKKCDLVITRSGATTISEIITLGLASILIPSPYVSNNHQYYNAKYLLDNEACLLIQEKDLTINELKEKIKYLLNNNEERIKLRLNSLKLAIFDSNSKIYKIIKEIVNES